MKKTLTSFLAGCLILFAVANTNADVVRYNLGEQDPGAADGVGLMSTTNGIPGAALSLQGAGGTYSNIAASGSTLSGSFDGNQNYAATGQSFYSGIDFADFSFSADVRPTGLSNQGFSIALSMGHNGAGAVFLYHVGDQGTWRLHSNGQGDLISGGTVNFNTWQNLRVVRSGGFMELFVDNVSAGVTAQFSSTGSLGDTFSIGAHTINPGTFASEGRFVGQIDNVSVIPEPSFAGLLGLSCIGLVSRRRRS